MMEYLDTISWDIVSSSLNRNLAGTVMDYYEINAAMNKSHLKTLRMKTYIIVLISVFAIISISSILIIRIRRKNRIISEKIILAENLKESIESNSSRINSIIQNLLSSKYSLLNELCEIINSQPNTAKKQQQIVDKIDRLIKDISIDGNSIQKLEDQVNSVQNGLISKFHDDLPNLKEVDYRLFLFLVLKMSSPSISLLLKEDKIDSIYNRKRRLKDKILRIEDPSRKELYLSFF